jgi:hypothetical protein
MKKLALVTATALLIPGVVFAQTLQSMLSQIGNLINLATPIIAALALLYFFWGLATYILAAGDEESKSKGRNIMIWGIIALFVIVSIWGLVGALGRTFGIQQGQDSGNIPGVTDTGGGSTFNIFGI